MALNKQNKNGKRGIEWTDYTWNVITGCPHDCEWKTPDGTWVKCYAMELAESFKLSQYYPQGFQEHYYHPKNLKDAFRKKKAGKIFLDSMGDIMSAKVDKEWVLSVLAACREAHWHTFQLLTKNAPKLKFFRFPDNVWVGVSMPATKMHGKELNQKQMVRYMHVALSILKDIKAPVRWMSFEPQSFDCAEIVAQYPGATQWAVIGALASGARKYQPEPEHVQKLLDVLDNQNVPVFFKGNLDWSPHREDFPKEKKQPDLFDLL